MTFSDYIEQLCREHTQIGHSDTEVHFTDLDNDAQNCYARKMHYPCVVLDEGDFDVRGQEPQPVMVDTCMIMFLAHVKDTGDADEIRSTFAKTRTICEDFLKRMLRDKKAGVEPVKRFQAVGCTGQRIYMKDVALYGYALEIERPSLLNSLDCNSAFQTIQTIS